MTFFSTLPEWYVAACLEDVASSVHSSRDGHLLALLPSWMRDDMCTLCLRVAKPYAALVAGKFLHHLAVAELEHLARPIMNISWAHHSCLEHQKYRGLVQLRDSFIALSDGQPLWMSVPPATDTINKHATMTSDSLNLLLIRFRRIMRFLPPVVRGDFVTPEMDEEMRSLHDIMACAQSCIEKTKSREHTCSGNSVRFDAMLLVNSFVTCQLIRNDSMLRKVAIGALKCWAPDFLSEEYIDKALADAGAKRLPSAATISRIRARIDVAYMLSMRGQLRKSLHCADCAESGITLNITADKSPQGGREYEMIVVDYVKNKFLPFVQLAAQALEQRRDCTYASYDV